MEKDIEDSPPMYEEWSGEKKEARRDEWAFQNGASGCHSFVQGCSRRFCGARLGSDEPRFTKGIQMGEGWGDGLKDSGGLALPAHRDQESLQSPTGVSGSNARSD